MPLAEFPRPEGDNGRGMHWIPTTSSPPEIVDRYVAEAKGMGVKWMVFLNDGASVGPNDYLVARLKDAGIEPVMRIYTPAVSAIPGNVEEMVRHYVGMGVRYFQPFNEPNLGIEHPDGKPSVERYVNHWVEAAQAITRGGGLPGFGALAPGAEFDDKEFLRQALRQIKVRGASPTLDRAWLSMHNYAQNHAVDGANSTGFLRFNAYRDILQEELGRLMPMIGTEGGSYVGEGQDPTRPAMDETTAADTIRQVYEHMRAPEHREPWNMAYTWWVIANEAGGGRDAKFTDHALFRGNGSTNPLVDVLRKLG